MIDDIIEQLNKHGLNGKKILDEVFDQYFKKDYENLKRFEKNHGDKVWESYQPCGDPECCKKGNPYKKIEGRTIAFRSD